MKRTKEGYMQEPPLVRTEMTPERLMYGEEGLYTRHYKACLKNRNDPEKVGKMFSEEELEKVGEINQALLNHGYRPRGLDRDGNVAFSLITTGNNIRLSPNDGYRNSRIPNAEEVKRRIGELRQKMAA